MNAYDPHNILVGRGFGYQGRRGYVSVWRRETDGIEVLVSWVNYDAWVTDGSFPSILNLEGKLATAEGREAVTKILSEL